MKIYLASDHGAVKEKKIISELLSPDFHIEDLGTHNEESTDYSIYAIELAKRVQKEDCLGILFCRSGIGVSMAANRFSGIRAARCLSDRDAKLSREHNNANVLCLAADVNSIEELKSIVKTWLSSSFESGRHKRRVDLFDQLGD